MKFDEELKKTKETWDAIQKKITELKDAIESLTIQLHQTEGRGALLEELSKEEKTNENSPKN